MPKRPSIDTSRVMEAIPSSTIDARPPRSSNDAGSTVRTSSIRITWLPNWLGTGPSSSSPAARAPSVARSKVGTNAPSGTQPRAPPWAPDPGSWET